jgi:DnaJ-class molecular chaperone
MLKNDTRMADLYSELGVGRQADEAEIKKAYRTLAKELHPDRNKGNPKASERFSKVTRAYDILTDKDKRAQYDRGEIDEEGNPKSPFGFGRSGPAGGFGGFDAATTGGPGRYEAGGEAADLSDLFEGLFGGSKRGGGTGPFSGFGGGRRPPPAKGRRRRLPACRQVRGCGDAEGSARSTRAAARRSISSCPKAWTRAPRSALPARGSRGRAEPVMPSSPSTSRPIASLSATGDDVRLDLPISLDEAVEGAKVRVPTVDGVVVVAVPKGASSGKVLRLKGKGFTAKSGERGDQLVTLMVQDPADDPELTAFVAKWKGKGKGNPRAALGV